MKKVAFRQHQRHCAIIKTALKAVMKNIFPVTQEHNGNEFFTFSVFNIRNTFGIMVAMVLDLHTHILKIRVRFGTGRDLIYGI